MIMTRNIDTPATYVPFRYPASDAPTAAIRQTRMIDPRRPIASEIQAQKKRPKIPATPTQTTRNEASAGVTLRIRTNRVVTHKVMPTEPVWLKPVRHDTARLRGYLN